MHAEYTFLRNRRGDKTSVLALVFTERSQGCFAAHVVSCKGAGGGCIVHQCVRDLKKWGLRSKNVYRSDGKFAIVDILGRAGKLRSAETLLEQAPKGDSKATGRAEQAIQN